MAEAHYPPGYSPDSAPGLFQRPAKPTLENFVGGAHAGDEDAAGSDTNFSIGPSIAQLLALILKSPLFYIGILLIKFCLPTLIFPGLIHLLPDALALLWEKALAALGQTGLAILIAAGWLLLIFGVVNAFITFLSTSYVYSEVPRPMLYVTSGILSRYTNTIDLSLVLDCDMVRTPFQMLFGSGTLLIQTLDGHRSIVPFVIRAKDSCYLVLSRGPRLRSVGLNPYP